MRDEFRYYSREDLENLCYLQKEQLKEHWYFYRFSVIAISTILISAIFTIYLTK